MFMDICNLLVVRWQGERDLYVLSTIQRTDIEIAEKKPGAPVRETRIIIGCRDHMNGVDKRG